MSPAEGGRGAADDQSARIEALEALVAGLTRELRERDERAEEAATSQRLEAIGRLALGIAHDIGNLVSAINGYADLALSALPGDHEASQDVREIAKATDRAASLLRQLLIFGRGQQIQPKPLDLAEVVRDLEPMLRRLLGDAVELVVEAADAPCMVVSDRGQMEQVVINLVVNARDAMPDGGAVTINVASDIGPEWQPASAGIEGRAVRLRVADTGTGIAPEALPKVFEPFFTTRSPSGGRGLGLSTVYGIVKQSGGATDVRSRPGEGAVFDVYLPQASAFTDDNVGGLPGGEELILVVDDELLVRRITERILAHHGYRVLTAASVGDGAEVARSTASVLDLVLADGLLPDGTAADTIRRVREVTPQARAIYMSVRPPDDAGEWSAWLRKPFTASELLLAVRRTLDSGHRDGTDVGAEQAVRG